jgi:hypothetical protein
VVATPQSDIEDPAVRGLILVPDAELTERTSGRTIIHVRP